MARSLTYSGNATLRTWSEPGALQNEIANSLRVHGWGFDGLSVTNAPTNTQNLLTGLTNPLVAAIPTWNYKLSVRILDAPEDYNPEVARVALTNLFGVWFQDVNIKLTHDSSRPMSTFLQNYGLYIAAGVAGLIVLTSLTKTAAPIIVSGAQRRYAPY